MLPHDLYRHYYDRPCEVCEESVTPGEDGDECTICYKLICDDCRCTTQRNCHVCQEKLDRDENVNVDDICDDCMLSCNDCGVKFHPSCQQEHQTTCSAEGRAHRAVANATAAVKDKKREIRALKRKLAEAEEELQAAKKSKKDAEEKVQKRSY